MIYCMLFAHFTHVCPSSQFRVSRYCSHLESEFQTSLKYPVGKDHLNLFCSKQQIEDPSDDFDTRVEPVSITPLDCWMGEPRKRKWKLVER